MIPVMIREVKYLEAEFINGLKQEVNDNDDEDSPEPKSEEEKVKLGDDLRDLGRRLLDLADEFIPRLEDLDENGNVEVRSGMRSLQKKKSPTSNVLFSQNGSLAKDNKMLIRNDEEKRKT